MASRETFSDLTPPPLPGGGPSGLLRQYSERFKTLFDASALPLTAVGGTADAVTATLDPPLGTGGLVDGMKFEITWAATNTAGVTLALNGGSAVSVLNAAGLALSAGEIGLGLRSLLEYIGGSFRILSPLLTSLGGGSQRYYWQITATGTWNKPTGLNDNTMVLVEAWAGGAGGSNSTPGAGGGGGGYKRMWMRAIDVPSSVSVGIGAGGAVNGNGGNTTFGALLTAFGGLAGGIASGGSGGGGLAGGSLGAGAGGADPGIGNPANPGGASGLECGGGGGGSAGRNTNGNGGNGGPALYGGGGGGGPQSGSGSPGQGGTSVFGGNGGANGVAGAAPGGGGGRNAPGARGEVRVWI